MFLFLAQIPLYGMNFVCKYIPYILFAVEHGLCTVPAGHCIRLLHSNNTNTLVCRTMNPIAFLLHPQNKVAHLPKHLLPKESTPTLQAGEQTRLSTKCFSSLMERISFFNSGNTMAPQSPFQQPYPFTRITSSVIHQSRPKVPNDLSSLHHNMFSSFCQYLRFKKEDFENCKFK